MTTTDENKENNKTPSKTSQFGKALNYMINLTIPEAEFSDTSSVEKLFTRENSHKKFSPYKKYLKTGPK